MNEATRMGLLLTSHALEEANKELAAFADAAEPVNEKMERLFNASVRLSQAVEKLFGAVSAHLIDPEPPKPPPTKP